MNQEPLAYVHNALHDLGALTSFIRGELANHNDQWMKGEFLSAVQDVEHNLRKALL